MLTIMDQVYPDCEVSINIPAPGEPCSDECILTVMAEPTVCDDNDTATPNDDTYTAVITVMPEGDCSTTGWRFKFGNGQFAPGGEYGVPTEIGPYLISDGPIMVEIADNADVQGDVTFLLTPPEVCSTPDPCNMTAGLIIEQGDCDNNGTNDTCLLYTSPSPRDLSTSRMPSSA